MLGMIARGFVASSFWGQEVSAGLYSSCWAHFKDLKNLVEVQLPGCDRLLVFLRVETPRDDVPSTPLD